MAALKWVKVGCVGDLAANGAKGAYRITEKHGFRGQKDSWTVRLKATRVDRYLSVVVDAESLAEAKRLAEATDSGEKV